MAALGKINVNDISKRLTLNIKITGLNVFRFRVWLGTNIIKIAAKVLGCGVVITTMTEDDN